MARVTVKERALALMSDGEPRTVRRIAYELGAGYSTVAQLMREGLLVEIGRKRHGRDTFPHAGQPILVHPRFEKKETQGQPNDSKPDQR